MARSYTLMLPSDADVTGLAVGVRVRGTGEMGVCNMDVQEFIHVRDGFPDAGQYMLHTRVAGGGTCMFDEAHGFNNIQWEAGNQLRQANVLSTRPL